MDDSLHISRGRKLVLSMVLNLLITIAQIIGGLLSGSLALLSDALHNLTDVVAILISWIANRLSRKECCPSRTFGMRRAELFAALINGMILIGVSLYILIEAFERISHPPVIDSVTVIVLGAAAVLINGFCAYLFKEDSRNNLNIKSVYLNLLTDMFTSVAVLATGFLMFQFGIYWADIVITVIISVALIYSATGLVREAVRIFMLYTPDSIDIFELEKSITDFPEIKGVHHVHIWQLVDDEVHLEAHLEFCKNLRISEVDEVMNDLEKMLLEKFLITHVTLQPEFGRDDLKELIMPLEPKVHSANNDQNNCIQKGNN